MVRQIDFIDGTIIVREVFNCGEETHLYDIFLDDEFITEYGTELSMDDKNFDNEIYDYVKQFLP